MKIILCANHTPPTHTGGLERVIKLLAESLTNEYGQDVWVLGKNLTNKQPMLFNGIKYISCKTDEVGFLKLVNEIDADYLMVFSDCFTFWPTILKNSESIKAKKSIALVGMNTMSENSALLKTFIAKKDQFKVITHSNNYQDYLKCNDLGIKINVIPNGVDLNEFKTSINFKEKYNIKEKHIILCVSNFFPGKGQEYLIKTLINLKDKNLDFHVAFICSSVNFIPAQWFQANAQKLLNNSGISGKIYKDLPREDVISAFLNSAVFAFPSQKEVAPLVILESMATKLPWVSLPVGNVIQLQGGLFATAKLKNQEGYMVWDADTYNLFEKNIELLLTDENKRKELGEAGYKEVEEKYNWDKIYKRYNEEVFI